LKDLVKSEVY